MSEQAVMSILTPPVAADRDHILGPDTAPVTLVEYGDYECPFCGRAHQIVPTLIRRLPRKIRFVFRHFPLSQIHPHSVMAAEAAEAAGAQGQFWEMHDMLFRHQHALNPISILSYADSLGLDPATFEKDLLEGVHRAKVHEDFMSGIRSGVNGTPTFFINDHRHDGAWDADSLAAAIAIELQRRAGRHVER